MPGLHLLGNIGVIYYDDPLYGVPPFKYKTYWEFHEYLCFHTILSVGQKKTTDLVKKSLRILRVSMDLVEIQLTTEE